MENGTADGLIEFLDYAAEEDFMNPTTAKSYRAAASQVLLVAGDGVNPGTLDIRELDVERALAKFKVARGDDYTAGSMATYQTRFRKACQLYKRFLDEPDSIKAVEQPTPPRKLRVDNPESDWDRDTLDYRFPLINGGEAYLRLPRFLARADVDRLTAFLKSIAIEPSGQGRLPIPAMPD